MITFEEALAKILKSSTPLSTETRPIQDCLGSGLAEDLIAPGAVPGFDTSAVDGYGVRPEDLEEARPGRPVTLRLQDSLAAGQVAAQALLPQSAIRVMTGAPIPPGVGAVVMQEDVQVRPAALPKPESPAAEGPSLGSVIFSAPAPEGCNIRPRGAEFQPGDLVAPAGLQVTPPVVAMLATLGIEKVLVHRKPRLGLIVTGSELAPLGRPLAPGQIRDSNSYGLRAAFDCLRLPVERIVTLPDDRDAIREQFALTLQLSDVVVLTGGVSVGDRDFVKQVVAGFEVRTVYWRIAMKPGKPNYFGVVGRKLIFGLPGNPVAALLSFHLLVRPAVARLAGSREVTPLFFPAMLETELRKKAGRAEFVRATLRSEGGVLWAAPLSGRDSHMMGALANATALIHCPLDAEFLPKGATVPIIPLRWNELV
jgi:molybdopterin molybdotransferase